MAAKVKAKGAQQSLAIALLMHPPDSHTLSRGSEERASSVACTKSLSYADIYGCFQTGPQMNPQKQVAHRSGIAYVRGMPEVAMNHPASTTPASRKPFRSDASRLPMCWAGKSNTREGELYRRIVRQLTSHVGKPSHAQELLIGRIAWLQVHLAHIDERAMQDGGLSPHATREYLAWSNSLAKLLDKLGLKGAPAPQPTIQDFIRDYRSPAAATAPAQPSQAPQSPAVASRSSTPAEAA